MQAAGAAAKAGQPPPPPPPGDAPPDDAPPDDTALQISQALLLCGDKADAANALLAAAVAASREAAAPQPTTVAVPRAASPLSDFGDPAAVLYGAFPTLFLLGSGLGALPVGALPVRLADFVLAQPTYGEEAVALTTFLGNLRLRWLHCKAAGLLVKANPAAQEWFTHKMREPEAFEAEAAGAFANPGAPASKVFLADLERYSKLAGAGVPFSLAMRNGVRAFANAYTLRFGPVCTFSSAAPSPADPWVLRASLPVLHGNGAFPALADGFPAWAAQRRDSYADNNTFVTSSGIHYEVPHERFLSAAAANPWVSGTAVWAAFDALFEALLRAPLHSKTAISREELLSEHSGVMGALRALIAVVEESGRQTGHVHWLAWHAGLSADFFRAIAPVPFLANSLRASLDSMFNAQVPLAKVVDLVLHGLSGAPGRRMGGAAMPAVRTLPLHAPPLDGRSPVSLWSLHPDWAQRLYDCCESAVIHKHKGRCAKGKAGAYACAMSHPVVTAVYSGASCLLQLVPGAMGYIGSTLRDSVAMYRADGTLAPPSDGSPIDLRGLASTNRGLPVFFRVPPEADAALLAFLPPPLLGAGGASPHELLRLRRNNRVHVFVPPPLHECPLHVVVARPLYPVEAVRGFCVGHGLNADHELIKRHPSAFPDNPAGLAPCGDYGSSFEAFLARSSRMNGLISAHCRGILMAMGCNTNTEFVTAGATNYVIDYSVKGEAGAVSIAAPLIVDILTKKAKREREAGHGTVAEDKGSEARDAKSMVSALLNHKLKQYSLLVLFGIATGKYSEVLTHRTINLYASTFIGGLLRGRKKALAAGRRGGGGGDSDDDDDDDDDAAYGDDATAP